MTSSITTRKLSYNSAKLWRDSLRNSSTNTYPLLYISIGQSTNYANEASPNPIVDTISSEVDTWDNIFAAKKVTGNDVELVIPRINWTANTKYRQYDDTANLVQLISTNAALNLKPMYVMNSFRNVYKCLANSAGANSTVEPTGDYNTSNGNIATSDGYIWKYMFNVQPSNKFLDSDWIPVPSSITALDYGTNSTGVVEGELTTIVVTSNGVNYRQATNVRVNGFTSGQTTLRLSSTSLILNVFSIPALSNLANMTISGTGIQTGTYILSIANANGVITLSSPTTSFGGNANNIIISTRIYIDGDGVGAEANAVLSNTSINVIDTQANIARINVTTIGTNYSRANAYVYGSGTGALARVILAPKFGHGFNSAKDLQANSAMVSVRIGEIDSTENGLISVDTSFRQISLIQNPYKYNANSILKFTEANSVISQTTNLEVIAGPSYTLKEFVYQGSSINDPIAYGFVNDQTSNEVRITKVKGRFINGLPLIGSTSGVSRTVTGITNPELEPYSGDILYTKNALKTDRSDGQAENIKLTISF
jgi:hypothetical protein